MKKHITIEQLKELSTDQKSKLRKLWKPAGNEYLYSPVYEKGIRTKKWSVHQNCDTWAREWKKMSKKFEWVKDTLPLLSIGQMIEILEQHGKYEKWLISVGKIKFQERMGEGKGYSYSAGNRGMKLTDYSFHGDTLCDTLWMAVKDLLK